MRLTAAAVASALASAAGTTTTTTTRGLRITPQQASKMTSSTWGESVYCRHAYAPSGGAAHQVVSTILGASESKARRLIVLGALYVMPEGDVKARRLTDPEALLEAGQYMRLHPMPRMYPMCDTVDWERAILHENDWCLLVHKPAAAPSHSTVDNLQQNVASCLQTLRPASQISAAHRLDVGTAGLIVMCKRPDFMAAFADLHAGGSITKRYTALVRARPGAAPLPPPGTTLTHYMMPSGRAPRIYRREPGATNWQICQLRVLRADAATVCAEALRVAETESETAVTSGVTDGGATAEQGGSASCACAELDAAAAGGELVEYDADSAAAAAAAVAREAAARRAALAGVLARGERVVEVEVELITGRTHQVRAQLSAEGYPLVGDDLYEEPAQMREDGLAPSAYVKCHALALQSSCLRFPMPEHMGGEVVGAQLDSAWWSEYIVKDAPVDAAAGGGAGEEVLLAGDSATAPAVVGAGVPHQ